jgi:hypothetical protein
LAVAAVVEPVALDRSLKPQQLVAFLALPLQPLAAVAVEASARRQEALVALED